MKLTFEQSAALLHKFWSGQSVPSPKTGRPMRAFFVDRSFNPQVVMLGGAGEHLRFDQKPRQIVFSDGHVKSMVRDAKERENPVCPQDFEPLIVKRMPAVRFPNEWDWQFHCPRCFSFGSWEYTDKKDDVVAKPAVRVDAPAFHDGGDTCRKKAEGILLPRSPEGGPGGDLPTLEQRAGFPMARDSRRRQPTTPWGGG